MLGSVCIEFSPPQFDENVFSSTAAVLFSLGISFSFHFPHRYPPITPEECADGVVNGILRNQLHVVVPAYHLCMAMIVRLLPYKVQHLFRDILSKEDDLYKISKAIRDGSKAMDRSQATISVTLNDVDERRAENVSFLPK